LSPARGVYLFVIVAFAAVISAPGLIQTVSELRQGDPPRALDVFSQAPTARNLHAYERTLEETSLVANRLRPWVQFAQFQLLADAGEKALVGRDGWLFYRPGVRYATERPTLAPAGGGAADPLPAIRSFRDQLAERGIRLLLVPVPDKESIYPEMLSRRAEARPVVVCERTRHLLDRLEASGIAVVDLFEVFHRAKQVRSHSNPEPYYLAQDSHWSPQGLRLTASAVARRVLGEGWIQADSLAYDERPAPVRRLGDLIQMLQVPQLERVIEPEAVDCAQVVRRDTGALYRDAPDSQVLILGDSFLRIYERDEPGSAGFIAHLARELRQPLTSLVNDGGASTLVRQELSRRPKLLANKRLVIWEFVERDIGQGTEGWQIVPLTSPRIQSR
jgi:hypothetical protein